VQVYEKALKDCGYTGSAMYWDWAADSGAPSKAAVWDPVTGFGGNGSDTDGNALFPRVANGPLRNLRPTYVDLDVNPHYLSRNFAPGHPEANLAEMIGFQYTPEIVAEVSSQTNYRDFWNQLESRPHAVVHAGISGDMGPVTSPNGNVSLLFGFSPPLCKADSRVTRSYFLLASYQCGQDLVAVATTEPPDQDPGVRGNTQ